MAGGRSSRMGREKATLLWQGIPLWQHQCNTLLGAGVMELVISCRDSQTEVFGDAILVLDQGDQAGPLSAIGNVIRRTRTATLVLGVDLPYVTSELLQCLVNASEGGRKSVVFRHNDYFEPLVALYAPTALSEIERMDAAGQKRLQGLWKHLIEEDLAKVLIPESAWRSCFENLNSPEQWNQHANPSAL